jgi:hypothetical protein
VNSAPALLWVSAWSAQGKSRMKINTTRIDGMRAQDHLANCKFLLANKEVFLLLNQHAPIIILAFWKFVASNWFEGR